MITLGLRKGIKDVHPFTRSRFKSRFDALAALGERRVFDERRHCSAVTDRRYRTS